MKVDRKTARAEEKQTDLKMEQKEKKIDMRKLTSSRLQYSLLSL